MQVLKICPMCGTPTTVTVDDEAYFKYESGALAQVAFPNMHKSTREVLISGMCYSCCEKIFNTPSPGNEAAFGNYLGECSCCGRAVYERDIKEDGSFTCSNCHQDEYDKC